MPEEKKRSFLLLKELQRLIQSFHTHIFLKNLLIQSGYPEELDHHHPQGLKSPLSNRIELFFRLLLTQGHVEILKGTLPNLHMALGEEKPEKELYAIAQRTFQNLGMMVISLLS